MAERHRYILHRIEAEIGSILERVIASCDADSEVCYCDDLDKVIQDREQSTCDFLIFTAYDLEDAKEICSLTRHCDFNPPMLSLAIISQYHNTRDNPSLIVDLAKLRHSLTLAGVDDIIFMPFTAHELCARIVSLSRIRRIMAELKAKTEELREAQERMIEQERQLVALQMAGATAHKFGQPLTSLKLNCHILESASSSDSRFKEALQMIKRDINTLSELITKIKSVDPQKVEPYPAKGKTIISLD